jgi:hypothetical protein
MSDFGEGLDEILFDDDASVEVTKRQKSPHGLRGAPAPYLWVLMLFLNCTGKGFYCRDP